MQDRIVTAPKQNGQPHHHTRRLTRADFHPLPHVTEWRENIICQLTLNYRRSVKCEISTCWILWRTFIKTKDNFKLGCNLRSVQCAVVHVVLGKKMLCLSWHLLHRLSCNMHDVATPVTRLCSILPWLLELLDQCVIVCIRSFGIVRMGERCLFDIWYALSSTARVDYYCINVRSLIHKSTTIV